MFLNDATLGLLGVGLFFLLRREMFLMRFYLFMRLGQFNSNNIIANTITTLNIRTKGNMIQLTHHFQIYIFANGLHLFYVVSFEVVINNKKMRPKSAKDRRTLKSKQRYENSLLKTEPLISKELYSSRKIKSKSPDLHQSLSKISNVTMVRSIKHIGIIHAYRPSQLKDCLVKNRGKYVDFYGRDGKCGTNEVFFRSVISHFRQWKKQLQRRLLEVFDVIMATDQLAQPQLQTQILDTLSQLRDYGQNLRSSIKQMLQAGAYKTQIIKLSDQYQFLFASLKHITILVKNIFQFTREISQYISQRTEIDLNRINKIGEELNKIRDGYMIKISESMTYCACHPDNKLLLRIQFFTKQKFTMCIRNALNVFESLKEMQHFQKIFGEKLRELLGCEKFDGEYLQRVIEFLYYKNDEIKLTEKKFEIGGQIKQKVDSLRGQIQAQETAFIKKFRLKCLKDLIKSTRSMHELQFLHLVKSKGRQYQQLKKKWLLVVKVYQQSEKESGIDELKYKDHKGAVQQLIKVFSNGIKNLSGAVQTIVQKMEVVQTLAEKYPVKNIKLIDRYREEIKSVEEARGVTQGVLVAVVGQVCKIEAEPQEYFDPNVHNVHDVLESLGKMVGYSRNQEVNNEIFKLLAASAGQLTNTSQLKSQKQDLFDDIFRDYQKKYQAHLSFMSNFQIGLSSNNTLKQLNRTQLISHLFARQFSSEFISNYPILQTLNNLNQKLQRQVHKQQISNCQFTILSNKLIDDYRYRINEQIKKLDKVASKNIFNRYIVFLYEHQLIQLLNLKFIYGLCQDGGGVVRGEEYNGVVGNFVFVYERVLVKNRRDGSGFYQMLGGLYERALVVLRENRFVCQYQSSGKTGQYFPSLEVLRGWMAVQFSCQFGEQFKRTALESKRQQVNLMFKGYIRKLQALKQKIKTFKYVSPQHQIWGDAKQTLSLLRQFSFQQSYSELLLKTLRYLRIKKMPHSALFSKDKSVISLSPFSSKSHVISKLIFSQLHVRFQYLDTNPNVVEEYRFDDSEDSVKEEVEVKKVVKKECKEDEKGGLPVQSRVGITSMLSLMQKDKGSGSMIEEIVCEAVADEIDEQLNQNIIEDPITQSNIIQSLIKNQPQSCQTSPNKQKLQPHPQQITYSYWTIPKLSDINLLRKCITYRHNQFKSLQNNIDIEIICQINKSQGRVNIITHIDQLLEESNKSDFLRMLDLGSQTTQGQEMLENFREAVRRNDGDLRNKMIAIMEFFRFQRRQVYQRGNNKIEAVSKEGQEVCFVDVQLKENNYQTKVGELGINEMLASLWADIKMVLSRGSTELPSTFSQKHSKSIEELNTKLQQLYSSIEQDVSVAFKLKSVNRKRTEERIRVFLQEIINIKMFLSIPTDKILTVFDAINEIDRLSKELKKLNVIQDFWSIQYDGKVIFMSQWQISHENIERCLLIDSFQELREVIDKRGQMVQIKRQSVGELIVTSCNKRKQLALQQVTACLFYGDTSFEYIKQKQFRTDLFNLIQKFLPFLKLSQSIHLDTIIFQKKQLQNENELINALASKFPTDQLSPVNKFIFESNRNMKYIDNSVTLNQAAVIDERQIQQFLKLIINCGMKCYPLKYKHKMIGIIKEISVQEVCRFFNIAQIQNIRSKLQIGKDQVNVKDLGITLINIAGQSQKDQQISSIFQAYLSKTYIQTKTSHNVQTHNCLQLHKDNKGLFIEVGYPQENVQIKLYNLDISIDLSLQHNQYTFMSTMEPVLFQEHFQTKLGFIVVDACKRRSEEELKRSEEVENKKQIQKGNQKRQAQREVEMLKIENEKLRILLDNQKLTQEMRDLEDKNKRKNEENKDKQPSKYKQEEEQDKPKLLEYKTMQIKPTEQESLNMSLILSQGHSIINNEGEVIFDHLKRGQKKKNFIQYDLTLSEHIPDCLETKEAKGIKERFKELDSELKNNNPNFAKKLA